MERIDTISIEHIRKKSKKRSDESAITDFICSKNKTIDKAIVYNRIFRLTQNVTIDIKKTDGKNSFLVQGLNNLKLNENPEKNTFDSKPFQYPS